MASHTAIFREWNFHLPIGSLAANRRGDAIAAATGDGTIWMLPANAEAADPKDIKVHNGVTLSLVADADDHAFLSGGDDGCVYIIDPELAAPTLIAEHKGKWIDHVAAAAEGGHRAYSVGKQIQLVDDEGKQQALQALPSSAGGLAFSPNGKRLAISHYNGLSLFWVNSKESKPVTLPWAGSHLGVLWHPDGKIVMTSLQENSLHGWYLPENKEMRMEGYASKIHSWSFTSRGRFLVTSGAEQAICWPFTGGGPWGKQPLVLGGQDGRLVTFVAAHPKDDLVAVGYADGMVVLAPLDGRMEIMINPPYGRYESAVTGMVWSASGDCLFVSLESGRLMLFTVDSVQKAVTHAG